MFAALVLEREPAQWAHLPAMLIMWIQSVGAVATIALCIGGVATLFQGWGSSQRIAAGFIILLIGLRLLGYNLGQILSLVVGVFSVLALVGLAAWIGIAAYHAFTTRPVPVRLITFVGLIIVAVSLYLVGAAVPSLPSRELVLTLGGVAAITAASMQLLPAIFTRFRWGRIWAIALLSIKEAIRSRVVLVFSIMALIFLFADWFVPYRPEDQVRNYVSVLYLSMTVLFLLTAVLLGAFNIPNDVRSQSIHTILTKPVERFEIVLGRFVGYGVVLTVGLAILSLVSLLYLARGVQPEAQRESYTARVPVFSDNLSFWGTQEKTKGSNVGRIWDYRSYITGKQYAIFKFSELPGWLSTQTTPVPFELTFDIFRLRKSEKDQPGLFCTFAFVQADRSVPEVEAALRNMRDEERKKKEGIYDAAEAKRKKGEEAASIKKWVGTELARIDTELIQKYKAYEVREFNVLDYETQRLQVPPALFTVFDQATQGAKAELNVLVNVEHTANEREASGMLGVARHDFYLLAAERPFWLNFLKGLIGMWCSVMLILGLAVACSTYLNGVISLLCASFIFLMGLIVGYLRYITSGVVPGGGPLESGHRLITRLPDAAPLENTPTTAVIKGFDNVFNWVLQRFLNVIPDINRYFLDNYVGNGFDISWGQVLFLDNFLYLVAYLVPWAVLAYYLMESREIANPS